MHVTVYRAAIDGTDRHSEEGEKEEMEEDGDKVEVEEPATSAKQSMRILKMYYR